jgi:GT2 family glycosyltransferase
VGRYVKKYMNKEYVIGIIIVTWNGKHHLEQLLPSLFLQDTDQKYKVVVIDNGSVDGTREYIQKYPEIDFIELHKNKGFAVPNNIGIEHLFTQYPLVEKIVFLNNDTLVSKYFLATLVSGFLLGERIGSVQTKIVSMENPKIIDSVGILVDRSMSAINKGQGESDEGQYDASSEIFGTTGSAMMVSRSALEAVHLGHHNYFDHLYFAYQEDVDLAWRMRLCGFSSWYVSGDSVRHMHSATGKNYSAFKSFHIQRNTLYTLFKVMPFSEIGRSLHLFISRYFLHIKSMKKKNGPAFELSKRISPYGMMLLVMRVWLGVL